MDQAFNEMPRAWYEIDPRKARIISYILPALALTYANNELFHMNSLPAHIVSATLYLIGTLADRYSTVKGLNVNKLAQQLGIDTKTQETNRLVSHITDSKEFMLNKSALALDTGVGILSFFSPGLGVGFTIGRIHSTVSNSRSIKRIERAIEIVKSR